MPTISRFYGLVVFMNMLLHVKTVCCLRPYTLQVGFSDGTLREVDLSAELFGAVFEPLRDPDVFGQVRVNEETNTIEWPNGADFAPEFLHEVGRDVKRVA